MQMQYEKKEIKEMCLSHEFLSHKVNISRLPYSADSYDLDLSVLCSMTNTSEKYERTQQGNLLG